MQELRTKINETLEAFAKENGLESLKATDVKFVPEGSFTFKMEGQYAGGMAIEEVVYDAHIKEYNLPPRATTIKVAGEWMSVYGMPNGGKKVVLADSTGKLRTITFEGFMTYLSRNKIAGVQYGIEGL
jgi:hypothetical protein